MTNRLLYYATVCFLCALIVQSTIGYFIWHFAPLTRIDFDL
jgi:hypothetical protein